MRFDANGTLYADLSPSIDDINICNYEDCNSSNQIIHHVKYLVYQDEAFGHTFHKSRRQIQETNTRMIQELEALEVKPYKKHRLYRRSLAELR